MNIAQLLKTAFPGATQLDIAREINVTQPAIHKWLTGKAKISPLNAIAIEQASKGRVTRYELCPNIFGKTQAIETNQAA